MRTLRNVMITLAIIMVLGIGINAFAHGSKGWGGGWGRHHGDMHYQGEYGPRYNQDLSSEEYKLFEQRREAFLKETQELRTNLYELEGELQNELAKDDPDVLVASGLQKEISELQSQLDQKRIDHMVEMKKLNPKAGRGFMRGGSMMGYGSARGGNCW
ncbi:MAG: periplasmic heavy metal sensor [Desulfobacterales bacterium]|nr:periplasmic heavy metal sensor [Desulfobacterales bacterium]